MTRTSEFLQSDILGFLSDFGPAGQIGYRVQITDVAFKDKSIVFEINGGPKSATVRLIRLLADAPILPRSVRVRCGPH